MLLIKPSIVTGWRKFVRQFPVVGSDGCATFLRALCHALPYHFLKGFVPCAAASPFRHGDVCTAVPLFTIIHQWCIGANNGTSAHHFECHLLKCKTLSLIAIHANIAPIIIKLHWNCYLVQKFVPLHPVSLFWQCSCTSTQHRLFDYMVPLMNQTVNWFIVKAKGLSSP